VPLPDNSSLPGEQNRQNLVFKNSGGDYYLCAHTRGLHRCYDHTRKSSWRQCRQIDEGVSLVLRAIKKAVLCSAMFRNGREAAPDLVSKTMW